MKAVWWTMLALPFLASGAPAAGDCALGQRYLELARERVAKFEMADAQTFLQQSIAACPSYAAYQQLGELAAQSTEQQDKVRAAEAFVAATDLAANDEERARTLFQYARLLNRDGDPQNAYPLIKAAADLGAGSAEIAALERTIEEQINHPTTEQFRAGLRSSIYRPLNWQRQKPAAGSGAASWTAPVSTGKTLNIPINFVTGSTTVDEGTRQNVATLIDTLRGPDFAGQRFVFVGHADARGDEQVNMALSWQRATAIYEEAMRAEPSLKDRIEVNGRGEYEPIDSGTDEKAYRANRRLQVLLKQ
jgi:outer membrane protein OmpA-like peptidoglycan-associated protein